MRPLPEIFNDVKQGLSRASKGAELERLSWLPKIFQVLRWFNIQLCNPCNIPTIIHWSTLLLFIYFLMTNPAFAVMFFVAIILSVVPHEYGHIFAAKYYGIDTSHVVLYPVGGMAMLKRMPQEPLKEFVITAAGPLVSLTLSIIGLVGWLVLRTPDIIGFGLVVDGHQIIVPSAFWFNFFALNLSLFIFNLVPAFPMDGGRLLRSILNHFFGYLRGTLYAVRISEGCCLCLGALGLAIMSPSLVIVPMIIMLFAEGELANIRLAEERKKAALPEKEKVILEV